MKPIEQLAAVLRRPGVRQRGEAILPAGTARRSVARVGIQVARDGVAYSRKLRDVAGAARQRPSREPSYGRWLNDHRSGALDLAAQRTALVDNPIDVRVECFVVDGGAPGALSSTLSSLRAQTYGTWTAVVLTSREHSCSDARVTFSSSTAEGVSARLGQAMWDGDPAAFLLLLEAGDELEPDAFFHLAAKVWERPDTVLVHWDDDEIDVTGKLHEPRVRPSWSPELLLSANPLGRSLAIRRDRLAQAGGVGSADDTAWWDLLLRLDLAADEVVRLPRVLAHLRHRPVPVPAGADRVVQAHLDRVGRRGRALLEGGAVRVRWDVDELPHVTIIIPTRHNRPLLARCLPALARTDYPSFDVRIIDNGERSDANVRWYEECAPGLPLSVEWWDRPFNYSSVNNTAASGAAGDVIVFLNDDTEAVDPGWLREMVGWTSQPDIGLVGLQLLDAEGRIQHGGVILGLNGFADHLFEGMAPNSDSLIGSTSWYRNVLSVTAACVAMRREVFERLDGFDERFTLCGSDVVLGLDAVHAGLRNVVTPFATVLHLESATRGSSVPMGDFFASFWRYQKWLFGGDPYWSPSLSMGSRIPRLRGPREPSARERIETPLSRSFTVFRQRADEEEGVYLADLCRADTHLRLDVQELHAATVGRSEPLTVTWYVPDLDSPFYGGINTALRMADHLARTHGVRNQFMVMAAPNEPFFRSALAASFPSLADAPITFYDGSVEAVMQQAPDTDVAIATLWVTAYGVAHAPRCRRKFYLIQDFEPMFYPAGTMYALTEETYRLGLYGLCNTERLRDIFVDGYGGTGFAFTPAVDRSVFHATGRRPVDHDGPVRVFIYARPGHWRNCWELASVGLAQVKERFGRDVHIVTAGSWARPDDLGRGIEHLGLLDYRDTGALYRTCDVGVALTVSAHPSYLPLELLACGVPVVAFDNPAGNWILAHEQNSLRCPRTADGLAEAIGRLVNDPALRVSLAEQGIRDIEARHASWGAAFERVYDFLADPDHVGMSTQEAPRS